MACPLLAAWWTPEVAAASALRWLAAGFLFLGSVVVYGMLAATLIANFITPALFVAVHRLVAYFGRKRHEREERGGGPPSHPVTGGVTVTPGDGGGSA